MKTLGDNQIHNVVDDLVQSLQASPGVIQKQSCYGRVWFEVSETTLKLLLEKSIRAFMDPD
jgi:hypothetical protein